MLEWGLASVIMALIIGKIAAWSDERLAELHKYEWNGPTDDEI